MKGLREQVGEILVKWNMPSRQAAINAIVKAAVDWHENAIGNDEEVLEYLPRHGKHMIMQRNEMKKKQRSKARKTL